MHSIVTKETWSSDPNNAPLPSDLNRIESNTRKVEENRQEETAARISDSVTLQNNIDAEQARAIADVDSEQARAIAKENTKIDLPYTGSQYLNTDYPVGTTIGVRSPIPDSYDINEIIIIKTGGTQIFTTNGVGSSLIGTWRARGNVGETASYRFYVAQRVE